MVELWMVKNPLTIEERRKIKRAIDLGLSYSGMALFVERPKSTVIRESKRLGKFIDYDPEKAQKHFEKKQIEVDMSTGEIKNISEQIISAVQAEELNPKLIEEQKNKMKESFEKYAQFFEQEDQILIVKYLFAYSERWNKTADETCERFKDDKEFLKNFDIWKSKQVSHETGA